MRIWLSAAGSIARRLFLTAAALSFPLLLVASILLTEFYRRSEVENFEQKLEGYLKKMGKDVGRIPLRRVETSQSSYPNRDSSSHSKAGIGK